MKTMTRLDKAGRIVLPKAVRDRLRLEPGDAISIEVADGEATLRHAVSASALTRESGIWVFGTGMPVSHDEARELLRSVREERLADLSQ
jgi:AbrB family looped-hinge helix DNA binding protein